MKRILTLTITALLLLAASGCRRYIYRPPVYRPVEFVPDSLVHDDMPKAEDETQQMLDEIEDEPVLVVPDIPKESDLLHDDTRNMDVERVMREGL